MQIFLKIISYILSRLLLHITHHLQAASVGCKVWSLSEDIFLKSINAITNVFCPDINPHTFQNKCFICNLMPNITADTEREREIVRPTLQYNDVLP